MALPRRSWRRGGDRRANACRSSRIDRIATLGKKRDAGATPACLQPVPDNPALAWNGKGNPARYASAILPERPCASTITCSMSSPTSASAAIRWPWCSMPMRSTASACRRSRASSICRRRSSCCTPQNKRAHRARAHLHADGRAAVRRPSHRRHRGAAGAAQVRRRRLDPAMPWSCSRKASAPSGRRALAGGRGALRGVRCAQAAGGKRDVAATRPPGDVLSPDSRRDRLREPQAHAVRGRPHCGVRAGRLAGSDRQGAASLAPLGRGAQGQGAARRRSSTAGRPCTRPRRSMRASSARTSACRRTRRPARRRSAFGGVIHRFDGLPDG